LVRPGRRQALSDPGEGIRYRLVQKPAQDPDHPPEARGKKFTTSARLLTDQAQIDKVLEKFRDKYGRNVKSYYPKLDVAVEVPLA
jgi:hypothetical protein